MITFLAQPTKTYKEYSSRVNSSWVFFTGNPLVNKSSSISETLIKKYHNESLHLFPVLILCFAIDTLAWVGTNEVTS